MSESDIAKFNDGGDPLEGSGYFNGGCGCGGVSGGSPWEDGGYLDIIKSVTGFGDLLKGWEKRDSDAWDAAAYISYGVMKILVIVLIVLLVTGMEAGHWASILLIVLAGIAGVVYLGSEWQYRQGKFNAVTSAQPPQ